MIFQLIDNQDYRVATYFYACKGYMGVKAIRSGWFTGADGSVARNKAKGGIFLQQRP